MGPQDGISDYCPHCRRSDRIVRAVDVRQDAEATLLSRVDVALPGYEMWSAMLVGAVALLFVGALATLGSAGLNGNDVSAVLMAAAMVLGAVGYARTRRNVARMRSLEPIVRDYHADALYCENCARIHFRTLRLPPGVDSRVAWTVPDYRRELWYACGFAKTRAWGPAGEQPRRHP